MRSDAITLGFFITAILKNSISSAVLPKVFDAGHVQNSIDVIPKARRSMEASRKIPGQKRDVLNRRVVRPIGTTRIGSSELRGMSDEKIYLIGVPSELPATPQTHTKTRGLARPRSSADLDNESGSKRSGTLPHQADSSLLDRRMVFGLNPKGFDGDNGSGWSTNLSLERAQSETVPSKYTKHKVRSMTWTPDQEKPDTAQGKTEEDAEDAVLKTLCNSYLSAHTSNQAPDYNSGTTYQPDATTSSASSGGRDSSANTNAISRDTPPFMKKVHPNDSSSTTSVADNQHDTGRINDLQAPLSWCRRFLRKSAKNLSPPAPSSSNNFFPDPKDLPARIHSTENPPALAEKKEDAWEGPVKPHKKPNNSNGFK